MPDEPTRDSDADTLRTSDATRPDDTTLTVRLPETLEITPASRYRHVRMLGSGGVGDVALVLDEVIGREVALKRLKRPVDTDPVARDAFAREAIVQGRLEHPSIVPVYDVTQDSDGTLFFTMRRVAGQSLADVITAYSRVRLLTAFNQICLAAHFAHEKRVVHRDIKPSNIMFGRYGEVYLLDWGIARISGEDTSAGAGTVGYMSPEQASGSTDIDARSDIYALGAILFEILTGTPMHERTSMGEMLTRIAEGVETRPSVRVPNADVPPELEAICVKATARDREHRYATARELAEAVERYLEGDRDLALRARMSREHGERARQLATRKTTLDRSEALGAVGRALALDPSNRAALATMVELLTSPPPDVPPEAAAAMRTRERVLDRTRSRAGLVVIAFWMVASLVTTAIVGVGQVSYLVLATSTVGIALVLSIVRLRQPRKDGFMPTYYVAGIGLAIAGLGIGFSPEYITPTIAVVFVISCTLAMDPTRRLLPMFIGCVAISLPFVLEWLGALDPSFVERDAMLCALARMTRMPDTALVGPLLMNIVCIVMGCLYAVRLRDALTEMQRRDSIHAWQLRQLVPARM